MIRLKNDACEVVLEQGTMTSLTFAAAKDGFNFADHRGESFPIFTRKDDDITEQEGKTHVNPYLDRVSLPDAVTEEEDAVLLTDTANGIVTEYRLEKDGLRITTESENADLSAFGFRLNLNIIGKKGNDYRDQLLLSSPYASFDGRYRYYAMTRPKGGFLLVAVLGECDGWRNEYYMWGHFIKALRYYASFDRVYGGSGRKRLTLCLRYAATEEELYATLHALYGVPICRPVTGGNVGGESWLRVTPDTASLTVIAPSGRKTTVETAGKTLLSLPLTEEGFHTVIPCDREGNGGMSTTLWYARDLRELFDRACDGIRQPYHPDRNLCEGGCFLWAWLLNMRLGGHRRYDAPAREDLKVVLGDTDPVPRRTILPTATETHPPYHIYRSERVQEQFFGVSILLEAYRVYGEERFLTYAVEAANTLLAHHFEGGKVRSNENDYTTVTAPVIPLVDLALFLKERGDDRWRAFGEKAIEMAEFLLERGFDFPTEGVENDETDREYEDGSISCTALSVLYVCQKLKYDERYIAFAERVLSFHNAWKMYTPDARMYGSSFRTWETIWEGDGEGPALCAGHAWTIWRAEALFYLGVLTRKDELLLDSFNGYVTNFCKTQKDGSMYACYEPDDIRGGGIDFVKAHLSQLSAEDLPTQYRVARDYPHHIDSSLSRYAWVRSEETWLRTAALLKIDGETIGLGLRKEGDRWVAPPHITHFYRSSACAEEKVSAPLTEIGKETL